MSATEPGQDCALCSRLRAFREVNKAVFPSYFNAPVPSFGLEDASLLIVGLAPGLKGANQTGRPFTGDASGDLLFDCLLKTGFAKGRYQKQNNDGLTLVDTMITNAIRCVPPENKPLGEELKNCRPFLLGQIGALENLKVILTLGTVAHTCTLQAFGLKPALYKFAHGASHDIGNDILLINSYHCSRYNVNTGVINADMLTDVMQQCRLALDS